MSLLWFCVLLLVASVCGNPPQVINLGTQFIPRYHNQYSDLVARILRTRGIRVYSVHDVGALTSSTLSRRFYGFGSDSSLGLDNTFVRSSLAGGRPSVTYEELYGGVDTSDLPSAAVPLVGSTLGTGPYGPGSDYLGPDVGPGGDELGPYGPGGDGLGPYGPGGDGPGPYGPGGDGPGSYGPGGDGLGPYGPGGDGPGPYGPGGDGPGSYGPGGDGLGPYGPGGDGPGPYGPEGDGPGPYGPGGDGLGPYEPGGDGLGPYGPGGDGLGPYGPDVGDGSYGFGLSGLSGFETDSAGLGGFSLAGAGATGFGGIDDGFSVSSGSLLSGTSSVYPRANYGPLSTGGRSYVSYQSTSPTYSDLYSARFSSADLGVGGGALGGAAGGAVGSGFSSFVDTTPYSGLSVRGGGYTDDYSYGGQDGGLGYLRSYRNSYYLPGYSSVFRRTRYFPRRQFTTRVYTYPPRVTTYQ